MSFLVPTYMYAPALLCWGKHEVSERERKGERERGGGREREREGERERRPC